MCTDLKLYAATEVDSGAGPDELRVILAWAQDFLVSSHPQLMRTGPVCPYTNPSLRRGLFYLACMPEVTDIGAIASTFGRIRERYREMAESMTDEDAELLTILVVFPGFDRTDSTELDALQRRLKDDFVADGLMIGQFHPVCDEPGLWNKEFRPLRSPVPLLAMRRMLVFDLPFLIEDERHFDAWLSRFAPQVPQRVRTQLTDRLARV